MKVTLEKKEKNQVHLEVEVGNDRVKQALERAYRHVSQQVNIPGFRKGKAPRQLVERTVGLDYIKNEALEKLLPEVLTEAVTEQNLEMIERPNVEIVTFDDDQPLVFKATVPVRPDVTFKGSYTKLSATAPKVELDPKAVDAKLDGMREAGASYEAVERALEMGDRAVIDFKGAFKESGEAFPGGEASDFTAEIAPGRFIDGFVEAIVGLKAGEEKDFDVTFPEAYHAQELAGKPVTFHVAIKQVLGKTVPALDDAFASKQGDFNTVADLRTHVEKELTDEAEGTREQLIRQQLLDQVLEQAEVELPDSMVEREINFQLQQQAQLMQAQGLDVNQFFTRERVAQWRESMREEAAKRIMTSLALGTIAKTEGLTVTPEEVDAEIVEYAGMYNADPQMVRQQLISSGGWSTLADEVLSNKILDWLREKADVTEGPVPAKYAPKPEGEEPTAGAGGSEGDAPKKKRATKKAAAEGSEGETEAQAEPTEA